MVKKIIKKISDRIKSKKEVKKMADENTEVVTNVGKIKKAKAEKPAKVKAEPKKRISKNTYGIVLRKDPKLKTQNEVIVAEISFEEIVKTKQIYLKDLEKIKIEFPKAKMYVKVYDKQLRRILRYVNLVSYGNPSSKKTEDNKIDKSEEEAENDE